MSTVFEALLHEPVLLGAVISAALSVASFAIWGARRSAASAGRSLPPATVTKTGRAESPQIRAVSPVTESAPLSEPAFSLPPVAAVQPDVTSGAPVTSWTSRLRQGLRRTHVALVRQIDEMLSSKESKASRDEVFQVLFESLVRADVGVRTAEQLVARAKECFVSVADVTSDSLKSVLQEEILAIFERTKSVAQGSLEAPLHTPHVVMMVGVNGVGKTTTTGKLAFKARQRGMACIVGAADTFRAAAVEQLAVWAERAGALCVRLKEGADPASVAFEAARRAATDGAQVCFLDTAGRLHNRKDLMSELDKIKRSVTKSIPTAPHEVLLVLDATTGQNALQQARSFQDVVQVTGLVLTKLDGTAKGGVVIGIANELQLPVRYIGVGEAVEDLEPFDAREFVAALFS